MKKYIKLSTYAKNMSIRYGTALRYWHNGKIPGFQDEDTGAIFVLDEQEEKPTFKKNSVAIYSRVSSSQNRENAVRQLDRLKKYAIAKDYNIVSETIEISSGLNDKRPKLEKLLKSNNYEILLVEHKDRLTRFGFNYIETLLARNNQRIEVVNDTDEEKDDLINDLVSIITSFCARIYGQKRKNVKLSEFINDLQAQKETK